MAEGTLRYTPSPRLAWKPQPDITVYELAQCMAVYAVAHYDPFGAMHPAYQDLPPEAQRHFVQEEAP